MFLFIYFTYFYLFFPFILLFVGARDGAAHLDQIKTIKEALPHITIIANGNVKNFEDCVENMIATNADGIMSAEGLLDDPALFARKKCDVNNNNEKNENDKNESDKNDNNVNDNNNNQKKNKKIGKTETKITEIKCPDKLHLGLEYLELAEKYPVKMKSVIFHIRRICRDEFTDFQLMEDCVSCINIIELRKVVLEALRYKTEKNFIYDKNKEKKAKEIYEKRKREEGKRKAFEDRMIRKAKREQKSDLHFYLSQGAENPSIEKLTELKKLPKEIGFEIWKNNFSQHCYNFHFEVVGCHRDRTCSFLHHDSTFADENAVAYG